MRRARIVRIEWECDNANYPSEDGAVLMCEDIAIALDEYCEECMSDHHNFIVSGEPSFEVEEYKSDINCATPLITGELAKALESNKLSVVSPVSQTGSSNKSVIQTPDE